MIFFRIRLSEDKTHTMQQCEAIVEKYQKKGEKVKDPKKLSKQQEQELQKVIVDALAAGAKCVRTAKDYEKGFVTNHPLNFEFGI